MYLTGHKFKRLLNSRVLDQQKKEHFKQRVFEQLLCTCDLPHLTGESFQVLWAVRAKSLQSCPTLWAVACQAPLSMGFFRQEHWNGVPFPFPGDLPNSGIEPVSLMAPELVGGFLTISATWEALLLQVKSKHMETSPVLRLSLCFTSLEM